MGDTPSDFALADLAVKTFVGDEPWREHLAKYPKADTLWMDVVVAVRDAVLGDAEPATDRRRVSYLTPQQMHRLDWACRPIYRAFDAPPYLVGSALTRPDYRDIDLRLILADDEYARMFDGKPELLLLLNVALSDLIASQAGLPVPIDFQIQSMTEANVPGHGARNPMGIRHESYPEEVEHG